MDKLDKDIMNVNKPYKPNADFTRNTMKLIYATQNKQKYFSWIKPFALTGTAFASALLLFAFVTTLNTSDINSPTQTSQSSVTANAAQATATQIASDIASLDKEVATYSASYSDTALDDISQ